MDKYLLDLIGRINEKKDQIQIPGFDSSKTISWKALREAEKLENKGFISQLIIFIENEQDKKKRDAAFFVLGHLAKNTNDILAVEFLISRIDKESDKYVISSLLDRISNIKKPAGVNLKPIIVATKNDEPLIRHKAIMALRYAEDPIAETILLEFLSNSDDPYDLIYANATLNKIGTLRAIPYLEKNLKSRKRDVKDSAKFAIEEINKRYAPN